MSQSPDKPTTDTPDDHISTALAKAPLAQLPNVFLLGSMKSGTSWLARQMQMHADVFLPGVKEPNLLMKPLNSGPDFGLKGPVDTAQLFHQMHRFSAATVPDYTSMYNEKSADVPLRLDASVRYLSSDLAADRLVRFHADHGLRPRLMILMRDPTQRSWSHWQMHRSMGIEPLRLTEALAAEDKRLADGWSDDFGYQYYSRYDLHLQRYFERFDKADVHIEIFEEVMADRAAAMERVCAFLGIDPARAHAPAQSERVRGKIKTGSSGVEQMAAYYRPSWFKAIPQPIRTLAWQSLSRVNTTFGQRQLPKADRHHLETTFAPMVHGLEKQLGRALPWPGGTGS